MARTISSAQTFIIKVLFPAIWIAGFGLGTLALFFGWGTLPQDAAVAPPPNMKWTFLLVWLTGSAFIYYFAVRLKRVRIDEQALYISNYLTEVRVPLRDVAEISENRWINIHPVTIEFHRETPFGERIVFMPKVRWFAFWSSHPIVAELRHAVGQSLGLGPGASAA